MKKNNSAFHNGRRHIGIMLVALFMGAINAYSWEQKEFMIGTYSPPIVSPDIIYLPGDFDGDGYSDMSIIIRAGSHAGDWMIDYGYNGFTTNGWEECYNGYTDLDAQYFSADFDGDGEEDLVMMTSDGTWKMDCTANGFGSWDSIIPAHTSYEPYDISKAVICPADYDGDGSTDLCIRIPDGRWYIDYAENGLGVWDVEDYWDQVSSFAIPIPADYDGDGVADIAICTRTDICIDYYYGGMGYATWDVVINHAIDENARIMLLPGRYDNDLKDDLCIRQCTPIYNNAGVITSYSVNWYAYYSTISFGQSPFTHSNPGGSNDHPVPAADFDGDGKTDYSYVDYSGIWVVDFSSTNGFGVMDCNYGRQKCDGNYDSTLLYSPDVEGLRAIKECNIDYLVAPPNVLIYQESFRKKDYYLAICDSLGLTASTMSFYNLGLYTDTTSAFRNTFVQHFRNAIDDDLEDNLFGMFLAEEPGFGNFANIQQWTKFFKRTYPEKPVLYNLLPIYATSFQSHVGYSNDRECYNAYLDQYITQNKPNVFYYDYYPFFTGNYIKPSYFYNMRAIQQKAGDIPYWATVLVWPEEGTGLQDPCEKRLRYMSFAPIAYGAKGIIYYDYRHGFMNNSLKYNAIKDINRYLKDIVAPVVMTSKNTATLHNSISPYTTNTAYPLENSDYISNNFTVVNSINKTQAMLGLFSRSYLADSQAMEVGSSYGWLFNKDTTNVMINTQISLNGDYRNKVYISPMIDSYLLSLNPDYASTSDSYTPSTNLTSFTIPQLNPGEGMFFKIITECTPCPADYDGDGIDDFAVKTVFGDWIIDYSSNGFGGCDVCISGCGGTESTPVPADYDGDGKADISFKTTDQAWKIDYAANGFGTWDVSLTGYGNITAIPVPADYDGDGKADLSVKTTYGLWLIDYAYNGFGMTDIYYSGCGNSDAIPVPADYDGDGKTDLSYKSSNQDWKIDYAANGFGSWDVSLTGYGNITAIPVPADYDGDGKADLSVKTTYNLWFIDYAYNGYGINDIYFSDYGNSAAKPTPADYDGDGKADLCTVSTTTNLWQIDYAQDGFNGYDNIKTNPLATTLNLLTLPAPRFERITNQEDTIEFEGPPVIDVYDLYGRPLLRKATPRELDKLGMGYYIIVTKQGEKIHREKYIVK